jgi:uncharacterized SAM-binding protein YcdF (DUF218 family)
VKLFRSRKAGIWLVRGLLLLLIILGSWFDYSLWLVTDNAPTYKLPEQADVIIVLGCPPSYWDQPSPCQIERTGAAVELWQAGYASHLILTGGYTSFGIESHYLAELAIKANIPTTQISLEEHSQNTVENLQNSKKLMAKYGWKSVILVSEPYHLYRARQQAADLNMGVVGWWPAMQSSDWKDPESRRRVLIREAVALIYYQSLGWLFY